MSQNQTPLHYVMSFNKNGSRTVTALFSSGEILTMPEGAENFEKVLSLLETNRASEEDILNLVKPNEEINPIKVSEGTIKRLFKNITTDGKDIMVDGSSIHGDLANYILKSWAYKTDDEWITLSKFLRKSVQNPSPETYSTIFSFIEKNGLGLDKKGNILALKYLDHDLESSHIGYGVVDGKVFERAHLPNKPGSILEYPREMVDHDKNSPCSTGLHVGSFDYVRCGGDRYVLVKVDPRDVVVIPSDSGFGKMRVCRYRVISEIPREIMGSDDVKSIRDVFQKVGVTHTWGVPVNEDKNVFKPKATIL